MLAIFYNLQMVKSRLFIVAYGAHDNIALAHSSKSNPTHCALLFNCNHHVVPYMFVLLFLD